MNTHVVESGLRADGLPRPVDVCHVRARLVSGDQTGIGRSRRSRSTRAWQPSWCWCDMARRTNRPNASKSVTWPGRTATRRSIWCVGTSPTGAARDRGSQHCPRRDRPGARRLSQRLRRGSLANRFLRVPDLGFRDFRDRAGTPLPASTESGAICRITPRRRRWFGSGTAPLPGDRRSKGGRANREDVPVLGGYRLPPLTTLSSDNNVS